MGRARRWLRDPNIYLIQACESWRETRENGFVEYQHGRDGRLPQRRCIRSEIEVDPEREWQRRRG